MNSQRLLSKTLQGFMWFVGSTAIHSVLRLIFVAVLARLLSPKDFGVMATAMLVVKFSEVIAQMGIGPALVQRKDLSKRHLDSAFTWILIIGGGLYGIFLLVNPLISRFFEMPELTSILNLLCLILPLRMLSQISYSAMQRNLEFKKLAGWDVLSYGIGYGAVGILFAKLGYGVFSLVYAAVTQALLYTAILYFLNPHPLKIKVYKKESRELFSYGAGFTVATIFNYMGRNGDTFVVSKFLGGAQLGFYDRAYTLMNVANNVIGSTIGKVMFPTFAAIQHDHSKVSNALSRSFNLSFGLLMPVAVFCYFFANDMVLFVLGAKWTDSVAPFEILCIFLAFRIGHKISGTIMKGLGFIYQHASFQFVYMALVVTGGFLVIESGITAVAWVVGFSLFSNFFFQMIFLETRGYKVLKKVLLAIINSIPLSILVTALSLPVYYETILGGFAPVFKLTIVLVTIILAAMLFYFVGLKRVVCPDIPWLMEKILHMVNKKKK